MSFNSVLAYMGEYQLQFMWVSQDRTRWRYANGRETKPLYRRDWGGHQYQIKGSHVCILSLFKPSITSETNASFTVLGILAEFESNDELQAASHAYNMKVPFVDDPDVAKMKFAARLKEVLPIFNDDTHLLLQACAEGFIDQAKKYSRKLT